MYVIFCNQRLKKAKGIVSTAVAISLYTLLLLPSSGYSAGYSKILIEPEDVGVFWSVKTQQFVAWGLNDESGDWDEITLDVGWESSDPGIVTIDETGLATAIQSWGKINIIATYPKPNSAAAFSTYGLLLPLPVYGLNVSKDGEGTGTVTSVPGAIDCGEICTDEYDYNTVVTLEAATGTESTFAGWSGEDCSGTGTCDVTVTKVANVTATFTTNQYALNVSIDGTGVGSVTSDPAGIICTESDEMPCSFDFDYDIEVTLTAAHLGTESTFTGWSYEGCSDSLTCDITISNITGNNDVTATFTSEQYPLNVTIDGTGAGTVTSNPAGIVCTESDEMPCSFDFDYDEPVTLTAVTADMSTVWSYEGCSDNQPCDVIISNIAGENDVTATFTPN